MSSTTVRSGDHRVEAPARSGSVHRLVRELLDGDYLVHIKQDKRFELGFKLHRLGTSLHRQIGVPAPETRSSLRGCC